MKQINVLPSMREWHEKHCPLPPPKAVKPKPAPPERTDISELEARAIAAISPARVTYCLGTGTKRFARDIQGEKQLTVAQRDYLWAVIYRFRRQIPDKDLVEYARHKRIS